MYHEIPNYNDIGVDVSTRWNSMYKIFETTRQKCDATLAEE